MANGRLRGGKAGDRHPVGGAGDVVEAHLLEEVDALGVATVLATDTQLEVGVGLPTSFAGHRDELAHAVAVYGLEGIFLEDALFEVLGQEAALGVVAAEAAGGLGEVVGAEG